MQVGARSPPGHRPVTVRSPPGHRPVTARSPPGHRPVTARKRFAPPAGAGWLRGVRIPRRLGP
eukprot:5865712-Pyramimonas_sp.AAC.1